MLSPPPALQLLQLAGERQPQLVGASAAVPRRLQLKPAGCHQTQTKTYWGSVGPPPFFSLDLFIVPIQEASDLAMP